MKAEFLAEEIGDKARRALLEELYTTPKPGLVDLYSCGAHTDMDVRTFEKSADVLRPYFARMAECGYQWECTPEELFNSMRRVGMEAEKAMLAATGGVNTHRGSIFTMGIFCAAAGRCMKECRAVRQKDLIAKEQSMTVRVLTEELRELRGKRAVSHGERNLGEYGTPGIRGEAIRGYPAIFCTALPALREGIREKRDWNLVKLQALLCLMAETEDSNILARQNPEVLRQVHEEARELLKAGGAYCGGAIERMRRLDAEYTRRNISAGGCADLLAAAIFLHSLVG